MPVMNYRKGTGAETSWIIEETSFHEKYTGKCESIFTQGNGYLGLRNSLEERYVDTDVYKRQMHTVRNRYILAQVFYVFISLLKLCDSFNKTKTVCEDALSMSISKIEPVSSYYAFTNIF